MRTNTSSSAITVAAGATRSGKAAMVQEVIDQVTERRDAAAAGTETAGCAGPWNAAAWWHGQ